MKLRRKTKNNPEIFWRASAFAMIWTLAIILLASAAFNHGVSAASAIQVNQTNYLLQRAAERSAWSVFLSKLRSRTEKYIRQNIVSIAKASNAGDDGLAVSGVNFIADNRALVFYNNEKNKDNYLAEVVFSKSYKPVKIEKFILKIKNNTDYSNGVYGAD